MKKGQMLEGYVTRVDFPNKGIVQAGEETCIVKNSLPGQKVQFCVNKVRKGKAEGRLVGVLESSPFETGEPCPHFGICGGCTYLSLPYEEQLRIKEAQVKRLLEHVPGLEEGSFVWEGIKGSPKAYEYRNKMEFSFGDEVKDGPLSLGMHKRGSFYDVVTVDQCKIVDEDYRRILACVREYFAERNVTFFHRLKHEGYLRHLLVRKASRTGEILVGLVTTSQDPWRKSMTGEQEKGLAKEEGSRIREINLVETKEREKKLAGAEKQIGKEKTTKAQAEQELVQGFLERLLTMEKNGELKGRFAGILHIVNDSTADVVKSDRTDVLYGEDCFLEELLGLSFQISTFSFFQTNSYSAEVLYETAREYVGNLGGKDRTVFDLYSGTGTIAQLMAPVSKKVIGVEIVEEAVMAARANARRNGLDNCEFITGDVLKVLDELKDKPDMIILDPPRDGIHPKALPKIIQYGVENIVYISCKPTSLTRDLEVFLQNGYQLKKAVAVDQFPWTANVETVVLLSQQKPDDTIEIDLDLDELDATAAETKATYEEIKAYVWDKHHLKVSSLYISQIKRKCGLEVGQNYNLSKSENPKVPKCPPEKEAAIMDALRHFQMI